jgi:hypothetical protein
MRTFTVLLFLGLSTLAAGEDSFGLRQRYGQPDVERFEVRPDIDVTVLYGYNGNANSLIVEPRQAFIRADFSRRPMITMDIAFDVVCELVPEARGKAFSSVATMQVSCGVMETGTLGEVQVSVTYSACTDSSNVQGLTITVPSASTASQSPKDFRARYGEPDAERFVIKRNATDQNANKHDLTLMVEYGSDHEPCRMRVEPRHEFSRSLSADKSVPVEEFISVLDQLVPPEIRGEELGQREPIGISCYQAPPPTEYQNVIVNPHSFCDRPPAVIGMELHFKRPVCEDLPAYSVPLN